MKVSVARIKIFSSIKFLDTETESQSRGEEIVQCKFYSNCWNYGGFKKSFQDESVCRTQKPQSKKKQANKITKNSMVNKLISQIFAFPSATTFVVAEWECLESKFCWTAKNSKLDCETSSWQNLVIIVIKSQNKHQRFMRNLRICRSTWDLTWNFHADKTNFAEVLMIKDEDFDLISRNVSCFMFVNDGTFAFLNFAILLL